MTQPGWAGLPRRDLGIGARAPAVHASGDRCWISRSARLAWPFEYPLSFTSMSRRGSAARAALAVSAPRRGRTARRLMHSDLAGDHVTLLSAAALSAHEEGGKVSGSGRAPREGRSIDWTLPMLEQVRLHEVIDLVLSTLDARDPYTYEHSLRVALVAETLAEAMRVPLAMRQRLYVAAHLHDIGKIAISDRVLNKAGRLTLEEMAEIQRHPRIGFNILQRFAAFDEVATIVLHHHERMDGNGYPDRLAGEAIPLESRIIAVADALDAMTSERPYRAAMGLDEAIWEIARHAGEQFDPAIVTVAKDLGAALMARAQDRLGPIGGSHHAYVGHEDLMHSRIVEPSRTGGSPRQGVDNSVARARKRRAFGS